MARKKLPKSIRKFIRLQKARIRREVFDVQEQERLIQELYQRFLNQNLLSGNKIGKNKK